MSTDNSFESTFRKVEDVPKEGTKDISYLKEQEGIYLFISIDLVNSTIFKTRYTKYWPFVIQNFYDIVKATLGTEGMYRDQKLSDKISYIGKKEDYGLEKIKTGGFKIWKLVGDEVLVYHKIVSVSELINTIRVMDYVTRNIAELFISGSNDCYSDGERDEFIRIAKRHLAAKTTMWTAMCGEKITLECPNMFYDSSGYVGTSEIILDFLGPDIDAGFRLCNYAEKNKTIVSPNLVALLSTHMEREQRDQSELKNEIEGAFRIVTYVELEDVWEKRLYPVFLYNSNVDSTGNLETWKKLFEYDEQQTSRLGKNIFEESQLQIQEYSYKKLDKIYRDLGRYEEIEKLKQSFKEQIEELSKGHNLQIPIEAHKFEFHISCVCCDKAGKKIWIHDHMQHGLSFGCVKIDINHDYREIVEKAYKEKYNIVLSLKEDAPLLSFYSVSRHGGKEEILGVILFATGEPIDSQKTQKNGWYSLEGAKKLGNNSCKKKIYEYNFVIEKVEELLK